MNKRLSERLAVLEEMGFDTSKYNVVINENKVEITGVAKMIVADKQIDNKKLFRRWITAQTFRMLYEKSYNCTTGQFEFGWDNYLRNVYNYEYQFSMMLEEFKVLNKLAMRDKEEYNERMNFFTKGVAIKTCKHYMEQFDNYVKVHTKDGKVKLAKYGTVDMNGYAEIVDKLNAIIFDMEYAESYAELYTYIKKFMSKMNKLPSDTPKCPEWKTAFKGSGAYYSLKNLVLFHNCVLRGCVNKQESIDYLTNCLGYYRGDYWKFHYMLLDTIECNHFNLKESINRNK